MITASAYVYAALRASDAMLMRDEVHAEAALR